MLSLASYQSRYFLKPIAPHYFLAVSQPVNVVALPERPAASPEPVGEVATVVQVEAT